MLCSMYKDLLIDKAQDITAICVRYAGIGEKGVEY